MVDRILELLKYLGMSPSRFADEIGVQRSAMSHLVSGRNNPSLEFISKVLKRFPEVDTEWLITGAGNITRTGTAGTESGTERTTTETPPSTLFSGTMEEPPVKEEPAVSYDKPETRPQGKVKKGGDKMVERIIIVYNDRTFRELLPDKD
jgi:transcriptional regulator with XRE-family HTH domain